MKSRHMIARQTVPSVRGVGRKPRGAARIFTCVACKRRLICSRVGETWLCRECRGGQGQ